MKGTDGQNLGSLKDLHKNGPNESRLPALVRHERSQNKPCDQRRVQTVLARNKLYNRLRPLQLVSNKSAGNGNNLRGDRRNLILFLS